MPVSARSVITSSEHPLASVAAPPPVGGAAVPAVSPTELGQPIFIDLETRSACDIELGGRRYAADPSTKLLSAVALIGRHVVIWAPGCPKIKDVDLLRPHNIMPEDYRLSVYDRSTLPEPLEAAIRGGGPLCAHNADGFDSHVWRGLRLPQPTRWLDTLPWTRAGGLPGSLDEVGQRLFGIGKDAEGKRLLKALLHRDPTPEEWPILLRYNVQDVLLLAGLYREVRQYAEPEVLAAHCAVNDRGIGFDPELAAKLIALDQEITAATCREVEAVTNGAVRETDLDRRNFLLAKLAEYGVRLPNLKQETVKAELERNEEPNPLARCILEARLSRRPLTSKKLGKAVASCSDGRLHDQFVYYGAFTGRWTGRDVQPHNLPKPRAGLGDCERLLRHVDDYASFVAALPAGVAPVDAVSALVRPCFIARTGHVLCMADFAGIEARVLAWCSGEEKLLNLFETGGDPYCDLASHIFGRVITRADAHERDIGKSAVLGCGYCMGADRFAKKCRDEGVDLAAVGLTAAEVVDAYRDNYPAIAGIRGEFGRRGGLWKDVEHAARLAIRGAGEQYAGRFSFRFRAGNLEACLPSGRICYYPEARLLPSSKGFSKDELVFTKHGGIERTYGGKLTENLVQATARDLLAGALVQCEREELPVVMHVHDEIVSEVPENKAESALRRLLEIMSTPPAWAAGLPIEVEGHCGERYGKKPLPGAPQGKARNGTWLA